MGQYISCEFAGEVATDNYSSYRKTQARVLQGYEFRYPTLPYIFFSYPNPTLPYVSLTLTLPYPTRIIP